MNFWEARQAALEGKLVKRLLGEDEFSSPYTRNDFLIKSMAPYEVNGHWEIVEEPKTTTSYLNVYPYTHGTAWHCKSEADLSTGRLGVLEIITDENGKLISARNV